MSTLRKILLVDDDDDLREALSEQLVMTEDFAFTRPLIGFAWSRLKAVFFADNLVLNAFFFFLGKWVFDILYFVGEQRVHGFELVQQLLLWSPLSAAVTAAVGVLLLFIMRPLLEPSPA